MTRAELNAAWNAFNVVNHDTDKAIEAHELMAEEEANMLAKARREMEAEKAAYDALPQAEKDKLWADAEARWAAMADAEVSPEDEDDGEDQDDD